MRKPKSQKLKCDGCGAKSGRLEKFDYRKWCPVCLKRRTGVCEKCGSRFYREGLVSFDGQIWCGDCLDEETRICADCGERIYLEEARYVGDDPVCERCYDDDYFCCDGCGRHYHNDSYGEDGYCQRCIEDSKPTVCPNNERYYSKSRRDLAVGVEIEAEGGYYTDVYNDLADKGFGVESDGSLDESGIEIQVPASNGGHTHKLVQQACKSLQENGFGISKRCGLHVHIEYPSRTRTIKRLLLMIYACEPVLHAINPQSRQDNTFCQPLKGAFSVHEIIRTEAKEIDKLFYSRRHGNLTKSRIKGLKRSKWDQCRYFGFNLHSLFYQRTVEFRYHAGTMAPCKIMRWVSLLKMILLYVRFSYEQDEVLHLIEQPTVLGKIRRLRRLLKLDEALVDYLVHRYIKFRKQYVWNN